MKNPVSIQIGEKLRDWYTVYEVIDSKSENSHSQHASHYLFRGVEGLRKGRDFWASNSGLSDYQKGGKFYENYGRRLT